MKILNTHPWSLTTRQAIQIQKLLRKKLILHSLISLSEIKTVAGADVSYDRRQNKLYGAVVFFSFPDLSFQDAYFATRFVEFPYIPGLLSFREIPVLLDIFSRTPHSFDVLLCDAHGYAHPRRFGLASHLGVILNRPTIGCAKSRLIGEFEEPDWHKGSSTPLIHQGETIGLVVRTRERVKPVYVSVGHGVDLQLAKKIVLACTIKYRLPEPLRQAHIAVNRFRKENETRSEKVYV